MHNIGIISTFPPTQCGIATYADDLVRSIKSMSSLFNFTKIELTHRFDSSCNKNCVIEINKAEQYLKASEYINISDIDIVDIQHEYKIFGKPDGDNLSLLLHHINKPIVSTLHTVSTNLNEQREKVFMEIIKRSDKLYVFSKEAKKHIVEKYKKKNSVIDIIPHGVPTIKFKKRDIREQNKLTNNIIFVSAGHMRNTKGYELAITALHSLRKEMPNFQYLILGSNHPANETAQIYRENLVELVAKLNLSNHVTFISNYLDRKNLIKYIQSADICLLPYTREDQSSSGIFSLMVACGRPIVSTPFQYAKASLTEFSGTLSDSFDYTGFKKAIRKLLSKHHLWESISINNHVLGQSWEWKKVAYQYILGYSKLIGK